MFYDGVGVALRDYGVGVALRDYGVGVALRDYGVDKMAATVYA